MRSLARVSRRAFHAVLLGGSASAVLPSEGGDVVIQESTFGLGRLTREQAQSFGPDLQTTDDLSVESALPFGGVYHHAWCGNAGQFGFSSRFAAALAQQCACVLGAAESASTLAELMQQFFGHSQLDSDSLVFVFVNRGHITNRHTFALKDVVTDKKVPTNGLVCHKTRDPEKPSQQKKISQPEKLHLVFSGSSPEFNVTMLRSPWRFAMPRDNPEAVLWSRHIRRSYSHRDGRDMGMDYINQCSPADESRRESDYQKLQMGHYFPNSAPLRRRYNDQGYTDLSTIRLVRTVHGLFGRPKVHEVVLDVNTGLRRSDPDTLVDDASELLSVLTMTRPIQRFLDQNRSLVEMLETKLA